MAKKLTLNKIYGDNTPLFLKMLMIFAFFSTVTIALFWALGFALSGPLYSNIRQSNARKTAKTIEQNISSDSLDLLLRRLSFENDVCIMIVALFMS